MPKLITYHICIIIFFTESERHISKLLQNQVCLYLLDLHIHFLGVAEHIKTHAYISQY